MDFLTARPRAFSLSSRLAGRPIPHRVPGYPWTPIFFVLVAAAMSEQPIYLAFRDLPSQDLAVAILFFSSASRLLLLANAPPPEFSIL